MPISKPIWHLTGTWTRQHSAERLRRSSHVLSVLGNNAYIFSGEVQPREPVDDRIDVLPLSPGTPLSLPLQSSNIVSYTALADAAKLATLPLTGAAPTPRVGSASATLNGKMYIFSGRGGTAMEPVDEAGGVWAFDPEASSWTLLKPAVAEDALPPARSYHCAASDGATTLFIHAGCPASGRLSDLWKFDIESRAWKRCADAPGPPRGGTSIAYCGGKMYRMGGFDGSTEVGGSVDVYDPAVDTWSTETFTADGHNGPEPRSVCALLPVRIAQKDKLLTLFGERDPSALGHAGAGKMLGDVWLYDVQERWWTKLEPKGSEGVPDPRGWFDADVVKAEEGNDRVVVHGGLGENNERLTDAWVLSF